MAGDRVDIHIRLPADVHQQLVAEAKRLDISLNALVLLLLRGGVSKWSGVELPSQRRHGQGEKGQRKSPRFIPGAFRS